MLILLKKVLNLSREGIIYTRILVTALTLSLGLTGCSVQSSTSNTAGNSLLNNSDFLHALEMAKKEVNNLTLPKN